jgi:CHAD domain-containing protein
MGTLEHREVERTYEVDETVIFPTLVGVCGVEAVAQPVEHQLEATYFDTEGLDLARHRVTLRRRTGGGDAGWHLKLPAGPDSRRELRRPLGRATRTPPTVLLDPVRALVRDRPLIPVAAVRTRRVEHALLGPDGVVLAVACDDTVSAERLVSLTSTETDGPVPGQPGGATLVWREWEVELADGDAEVLEALEPRLLDSGAQVATTQSKLARALGDAMPAPADQGRADGRKRRSAGRRPVAELVLACLREQYAELLAQDRRLRLDEEGAVHRMRIAARRLRSTLATHRSCFEPDETQALRAELRWLGRVLSGPRDAQVLSERLGALLDEEPAALVMGPVRARVDADLSAAHRGGMEAARQVLDGERYFRLLDGLERVLGHPPLAPAAQEPSKEALRRALSRDARRLRRSVRDAEHAEEPAARDGALHEARKRAKRLRYAAEGAVPVLGSSAKRLGKRAKAVQDTLGAHQDTVASRGALRGYAVQAHLSGENAFPYGRLHALEQEQAAVARRAFARAWKRMPRNA